MSVQVVSSGVASGGLTVSSGDQLEVLSGGTVLSSIVDSGAVVDLSSGGLGSWLHVSAGGELVGSGAITGSNFVAGAASGVVIEGATVGYYFEGGSLEILSGGVATAVTVQYGALQVDAGGTVSGTLEPSSNGSFSTIQVYGAAVGDILGSGTQGWSYEHVESGGVTSNTTVDTFGEEEVESGGVASGAVINSGGSEVVWGAARGTLVSSGGTLSVYSGGVVSGTVVSAGGSEAIMSGAVASGTTVLSGATEYVAAGALAAGVTVSSGGAVTLAAVFNRGQSFSVGTSVGATTAIDGVTIQSGGSITLQSATVFGGASLAVAAGATITGVTVSSGGVVSGPGELAGSVHVAGLVSGVSLGPTAYNFGYVEVVSGGAAVDVIVHGETTLQIDAGATASGMTLALATSIDAADQVYGTAVGTVISYGDTAYGGNVENVHSGGVTSGAIVKSGGLEQVSSGGVASGAVIDSGGSEVVYGRTVSGVINSGGAEIVYSGGDVSGTTVSSGGLETLLAGATVSGLTVSSGGTLVTNARIGSGQTVVATSGAVSGATSIGGAVVLSGGVLDLQGATILSGGTLSLTSTSVVSGVTVSAGGLLVGSGLIEGSQVYSLNYLAGLSYDFGVVSGVLLGAGYGIQGAIEVRSGGLAGFVTIQNGAVQVDAGGVATGAVLAPTSNGVGWVSDYGSAVGTIVMGNSAQNDVQSGGVAQGTVLNGGYEFVSSGGLAIGTIIDALGSQVVYSGGSISATIVNSGGVAVVSAGAFAAGATVNSGGTLMINAVISAGQIVTATSNAVNATTMLGGATVYSGGVLDLTGATIFSGGTLSLVAGASISGVTVFAGGTLVGPGVIDGSQVYLPYDVGGLSYDYGLVSGVSLGQAYAQGALVVEYGGSAVHVTVETGELFVKSGGFTYGTVLDGGGVMVSAGGVASETAIGWSGVETALSGGAVYGTVVGAGGFEILDVGAMASGLTVSSGGTLEITTVVSSGQSLSVGAGATISGEASILAGGTLDLVGGGVASGGSLAGGVVIQGSFFDAGVVSGATVGAMYASGAVEVQSGGVAAAMTFLNGQLTIDAGGIASSAVLSSINGLTNAYVAGLAVGTVDIGLFTKDFVESGGVVSGTLLSGGSEIVEAGGLASGTVIGSQGYQLVASGGGVSGTIVQQGGTVFLSTGAIAAGVTVNSGGTADLNLMIGSGQSMSLITGEIASGTAISGVTLLSGAVLNVQAATVLSGGTLNLIAGSTLSSITVSAGGDLVGPGAIVGGGYYYGAASATVAGDINGASVGTASQVGILEIKSGGLASAVSVLTGQMSVDAGATASGTVISAMNYPFGQVLIGGQAFGTLVEGANAQDDVQSGGSARGTVISGGVEYVLAGGVAVGTIVDSGGSQTVYSGGAVSGTAVNSGGLEILSSGAAASGVIVSSGGALEMFAVVGSGQVLSIGSAVSSTIISGQATVLSGGGLRLLGGSVASGGLLAGSIVIGGAYSDAGVVSGVDIGGDSTQGSFEVLSGGQADDVTVTGDQMRLDADAVASGTVLSAAYFGVLLDDYGRSIGAELLGSASQDDVESGGVAIGTVLSGGLEVIFTAGAASGSVINNYGIQTIRSGGVTSGAVVNSGGLEILSSGAVATDVTVNSGGTLETGLVVNSGQNVSLTSGALTSATVLSGVTILSGGVLSADSATVLSGGTLNLASGGVISALIVSLGGDLAGSGAIVGGYSYGSLGAQVAGVVSGVTVGAADAAGAVAGELEVESGGRASGVKVIVGALQVDFGATADATTLLWSQYAGPQIDVYGTAVGTLVGGLTSDNVESGGVTRNTVISGGSEYVLSGGLAIGGVVEAGSETVVSGGSVSGTVVSSGGLEDLNFGAIATNVTIGSGGTIDLTAVISAGVSFTDSAAVIGPTGLDGVQVLSGGVLALRGAQVLSGGSLAIGSGAIAPNVLVSAGGVLLGPGSLIGFNYVAGAVSGVSVGEANSPLLLGYLAIQSGGSASGITLNSSSTLQVDAGATTTATSVGAGATEQVESGGLAVNAIIGVGGSEIVSSGGVASGALVGSHGGMTIESGGATVGGAIDGVTYILSGGSASGTAVSNGGVLHLYAGGQASRVTVSSGGTAFIQATISAGQRLIAGEVTGTTNIDGVKIQSGGVLDFENSIVLSGAILDLLSNSLIQGVTVSSGGAISGPGGFNGSGSDAGFVTGIEIGPGAYLADFEVLSGGRASNVTVINGDLQIDFGAAASGTTLTPTSLDGAYLYVSGVATDTLVGSGGVEWTNSGGMTSGSIVSSGGTESVQGVASGDRILTGATEWIESGGVDSGGDISSGASLIVWSGGALSGTTIESGATLQLNINISGGETILAGIASANETVDGATVLNGGIVEVANAKVMSGGALSLGSGGGTPTVTVSAGGLLVGPGVLAGSNYDAGAISGVVLSGVTISDFAGTWPAESQLLVESGGSTSALTVEALGQLTVISGGSACGTVVSSGGAEIVSSGAATSRTVVSSGGKATLLRGATETAGVVLNGGVLNISAGATVSGETVSSGGILSYAAVISAGHTFQAAVAADPIVEDGFTILSGGSVNAYNAVVLSGATLSVGATGLATNVTVSSGGLLTGIGGIYGPGSVAGTISGVTLSNSINVTAYNTDLSILFGGLAENVTAVLGADLTVQAGGVAAGTLVGFGGYETLMSGGTALGAVVSNGGRLELYNGAVASGVTVENGGAADFYQGLVVSSGQSVTIGQVQSTTIVSGVTISSGGGVDWSSVLVQNGGTVNLMSHGGVYDIFIAAGGSVVGPGVISASGLDAGILSGATLSTASIYNGYPESDMDIVSGGVAGSVIVEGSYQLLVTTGAIVNGTSATGYGEIHIVGGLASGSVLTDNGDEIVDWGGLAIRTTANSDGIQWVYSGGVASGTNINTSGVQEVYGGLTFDAVVNSGGYQYIAAGLASGTLIESGGVQEVFNNGAGASPVAIDTHVASGGIETVFSGGVASGTVLDGGGEIKVDAGAAISGLVALKNAEIDLIGVSATSASVNADNQLVATSGGVVVATLGLASSEAGVSFSASSDSQMGTILTAHFAGSAVSATAATLSDGELDVLQSNSALTAVVVSDNGASGAGWVRADVAQLNSDAGALGKLIFANGQATNTVKIRDTSANIAADLNAINGDAQVGRITSSDSLALTVSVAQLTLDGTAFAELHNTNGAPFKLAVVDSAAQILPALGALDTNIDVSSITVTGVSVANLASVTAGLAGSFLPKSIQVTDTALNLSDGALDTLQANHLVTSIVVSDNGASGASWVRANVAQLNSDAGTIAKLVFANGQTVGTVKVRDTTANILTDLSGLSADTQVSRITSSDSEPLTLVAAQLPGADTALGELHNGDATPVVVTVKDTAIDLSDAVLDVLQNAPAITSIVVSDNGASGAGWVRANVQQLTYDAAALAKLTFADGQTAGTVKVRDTSFNLSGALDFLNSDTQVSRITSTDNLPITLNVSQLSRDTLTLGELHNSNGTPVRLTVEDIASNLSGAELDVLQAESEVTSIVVDADSYGGNSIVRANIAQLTSDAGAIAKMTDQYGAGPKLLNITDTAAAIAADLAGLAANSQIGQITVTDNQSFTVNLAQLASDGTAISWLRNADDLPVQLEVSDTAINLADGELDALQANPAVGAVVVSDNGASGAGWVRANVAQLTSDAGILSKLAFANGQTANTVKVRDTSANIQADLNALGSDVQVGRITSSDNLSITVSVAQLTNDAAALSELHNSNGAPVKLAVVDVGSNILPAISVLDANSLVASITITGVAVANLAAVTSGLSPSSLTKTILVSDTALNLSDTALDTLQSNPLVTSVVVSDDGASGAGWVRATVAQLTTDAGILSKLVFADGQATNTVKVRDTSANISADLDALSTDVQIGRITSSDSLPINVTVAELTRDAPALGELHNANGSLIALNVVDTAINLSDGVLDSLQANPLIASIVVSDNGVSGAGWVRADVAQLTGDAGALGKLVFADGQATNTVKLRDTSANIAADFNALNGDAQVGRITSLDNRPITVAVADFTGDTTAIAELHNANAAPVIFDVTGATASFNGATLSGFVASGDVLDLNDLNIGAFAATFTENSAGTAGVLQVGDGTRSAAITLMGQYMAAGFSGSAAAAGFSAAANSASGTNITYTTVVPPHQ